MKCNDYQRIIFLFEESTEQEQKQLMEHTVGCRACAMLLAQVREQRTALLSTQVPGPDFPSALTAKIMARIEKESRPSIFAQAFALLFSFRVLRYSMVSLSLVFVSLFIYEATIPPVRIASVAVAPVNQPVKNTTVLSTAGFMENFRKNKTMETPSLIACIRACESDGPAYKPEECNDCHFKNLIQKSL
jgi:hypothetical protein